MPRETKRTLSLEVGPRCVVVIEDNPFSLGTLEMFATTTSTDVTDYTGNRKSCPVRNIGSELSYYGPDFVDDNTVQVYCGYSAMALLGEKG
jgi:hypothetical protein